MTVTANNEPLKMEIDTGAAISVISEATYKQAWKEDRMPTLHPSKTRLHTFTGEEVTVVGALMVEVEHGQEKKQLPLIVAKGQTPSLLGRNWLAKLKLDWKAAYQLQASEPLAAILKEHEAVFREELGTIRGTTAKIQIGTPRIPQTTPTIPQTTPSSIFPTDKGRRRIRKTRKRGNHSAQTVL